MKRLGGWDAVLLYNETPTMHQHTLKVAVVDASDYEGDFTFELFRRTLWRRLYLLDPLRYRLVNVPWKLHHPMWLENSDVDLDYHLRRLRVASPGGRRELDEAIGVVASTPLDRSRPLWEFHFVEGMANHRFAIIGKVHHSLADGLASANLMARALDLQDAPQVEQDLYVREQSPSKSALLRAAARDHVEQLKGLPDLLRYTVAGVRRERRNRRSVPGLARNFHPPATFINHPVSAKRTFASATLALADVKQISKALGVTINELVLAISAGALRTLLLRYDGRADEPLIGSVPVSIDASPNRISGNQLGALLVSLPVHSADPLEWVRLCKVASTVGKESSQSLGPELLSRWANYLPPALAELAFGWLSTREAQNKLLNVPISNVPGPRERGRIAGAPLTEIYSVGPLTIGSGINITVWSYVDQLNISVLADDATMQDPHELTDAMLDAFVEIRRAAGFPVQLTDVATTM
jgi:diacylglycerol O-acyltransferase